jgi:hypothetical protein
MPRWRHIRFAIRRRIQRASTKEHKATNIGESRHIDIHMWPCADRTSSWALRSQSGISSIQL